MKEESFVYIIVTTDNQFKMCVEDKEVIKFIAINDGPATVKVREIFRFYNTGRVSRCWIDYKEGTFEIFETPEESQGD
jgi:hypothetical protein